MTEVEWATGTDPATLAHGLHRLASQRKLLLFSVVCYWRFLTPPGAEPNDRLVEVLERYADGQSAFEDVVRLRTETDPSHPLLSEGLGSTADFWTGEFGQYHAAWQTAAAVARTATRRKPGRPSRAAALEHDRVRAEVLTLLRCVVGNPFRPNSFDPAWRTSTVVALARGVYEEQAFDRLPILADAPQDAGCNEPDLLAHCRSVGPHARGCWAVDVLLGRRDEGVPV